MKKQILTLGLAALCAFAASAETKIATIDLRKVFDAFYKTRQADANLKDEATKKEKERKDMVDELRKSDEEYRKLLDKSNDQAISAEEREKSRKASEQKLLGLKEMEQIIQTFQNRARTELAEKQRRKRDDILEEIKTSISLKSKAGGYSLVVDSAAESINNTPVVMFNDGSTDLTDAVLKDLNASAPPEVIKALDERDKAEKEKSVKPLDDQKK